MTLTCWTVNTPLFVTPQREARVAFSRPVWALADGLMVRADAKLRPASYEAMAANAASVLGVVAAQVQEQSAREAGMPTERITCFADQRAAVEALRGGLIDAYASVAAVHRGFLLREPDAGLAVVDLGARAGQLAAVGAYSFAKANDGLRRAFDAELRVYLGSSRHRAVMRRYGFGRDEFDRVL